MHPMRLVLTLSNRRCLRTAEAGSRWWRPASTSSLTTKTSCHSIKATWSLWHGRRRGDGGRAHSTARQAGFPVTMYGRSNSAVSWANDARYEVLIYYKHYYMKLKYTVCLLHRNLQFAPYFRSHSTAVGCITCRDTHTSNLFTTEKQLSPKGTQLTKNYYSVVSQTHKNVILISSPAKICFIMSERERFWLYEFKM